ncbi:hypothetical protein TrCOL_g10463 [Triparma columacea]|uniref:Uncharacterized protein n=1 Tax=Triparma columacea TaxID=722753 RepID=A0A9W7GBZ4_9STRA|nr:hypothetical protein TrCOL_g10463 [Triparma columacea]
MFAVSRTSRALPALRSLSRPFSAMKDVDGLIPSDAGRQIGRRAEELEAEKSGVILYNRDPVIPPAGQGSYDNPIMVQSGLQERAVGFEDPGTHAIYWFNLNKGPVHYVKQLDMYFKMDPV